MVRTGDFWIMPNSKAQGIDLSHPKIRDAQSLRAELETIRMQNEKLRVVFTNGCFDILHPGHVNLLSRAKQFGDILILALNTDNSVKSLGKGKNRPINPLAVRAFTAAHLHAVDFVTSFDETTPYNLIKLLKPNVLIKGGDWPVESIVGNDIVTAYGGKVLSLSLLDGFSTTKLIENILVEV